MSALAQSPNLFCALRRRINEQEAILTIGHAALNAVDAVTGLDTVANVALRLTGVHEVQVRLHASQDQTELLEWRRSTVSSPASSRHGTATGLMVAIPAVIAFNYFQKQVKGIMLNLNSVKDLCLAYAKSGIRKGDA